MKVTVTTATGTCQVRVPSYRTLTPESAKAAREVAAGKFANATVTDGHTTYRVTRSGVRKI
jgi:hypothetical protein